MTIGLGILLLLTTTLTGSVGALFLKKAMDDMPELTIGNVLTSRFAYLGLFFYILSAVTNIFLLGGFEYSVVFPMTSLTYVWTALISIFIFSEKVSVTKIIAIALVILGVFMISQ